VSGSAADPIEVQLHALQSWRKAFARTCGEVENPRATSWDRASAESSRDAVVFEDTNFVDEFLHAGAR
jgi:hypothetical protein